MQIVGLISKLQKDEELLTDKKVNIQRQLSKKYFQKFTNNIEENENNKRKNYNSDNENSSEDLSDIEKLTKKIKIIPQVKNHISINSRITIENHEENLINNVKIENEESDLSKSKKNWIQFKLLKLKSQRNTFEDSELKDIQNKYKDDKNFLEIRKRKVMNKEILKNLIKNHVISHYIPKEEKKNLIYRNILNKDERERLISKLNNLLGNNKIKNKINKKTTNIYDFSDDSIDYSLFNVKKITSRTKTTINDKINYMKKKKITKANNEKRIKTEIGQDFDVILNHFKYLDIN